MRLNRFRSSAALVAVCAAAGCAGRPATAEAPAGEIVTQYPRDHARGRDDAASAIAAGRLVLLVPGTVPAAEVHRIRVEEYARFGIVYELTGDAYDPAYEAYRAGFNALMEREIVRRHGPGTLDRIREAIDRRLRDRAVNGIGAPTF